MSEFSGKSVLITGAGRGIGRQIALDFGIDGANVCVNYSQSAEEAEKTVADIVSAGGNAKAFKADITSSGQVNAMVDAAMDSFGDIDILVNNAGLSIDGPFLEITETDWDKVHAVNLKGPFLVSQAVARHMMKGDGGVMVNISAISSHYGRIDGANYCSSKAGLNMLTKCMALELGQKVRVNGLGLGYVDSTLVREVFSEEQLARAVKDTPLKRMTTYAETASFIKLLASQSTSFVTGQTIMFDGGLIMR